MAYYSLYIIEEYNSPTQTTKVFPFWYMFQNIILRGRNKPHLQNEWRGFTPKMKSKQSSELNLHDFRVQASYIH